MSKQDAQLSDLVKERGILKGRLTKLSNYVNNCKSEDLSSQTKVDLKLRSQSATLLYTDYNKVQTSIEKLVDESELDSQLCQRESFEDIYYSTIACAECMLTREVCSQTNNNMQSIKLPTISIPTFDGNYEHWLEFRDTFLSLVHNSRDISAIQKFHYLKSSLKGSAALVIDSLEFSSDNYVVAWELLLNRYNNTKLLVNNHVKALFTIQKMNKECPHLIRKVIDTILKNLRALTILKEPTEYWDTLINYIVTSKLDETTEREWEQYKITTLLSTNSEQIVKTDDLLNFLRNRADMLETLLVSHGSKSNNNFKKQSYSAPKVHCNVGNIKNKFQEKNNYTKKSCLLCPGNHPIYACQKFLDSNLESKMQFIIANKLCQNCLRAGHSVETCKFGPCRKCNTKHNTLIHSDVQSISSHSANTQKELMNPVNSQDIPVNTTHNNQILANNVHLDKQCNPSICVQPVLLSTALIEIADKYNNYHIARALLDSGSQHCFITKTLCDLLNIQLIQSVHEIRGVGSAVTHSTQMCDVDIKSRISSYSAHIKCFVLPNITSTLPAVCQHSAQQFRIPDNIQLGDEQFLESHDIQILLGANIFWDLLKDGKMRLPNGPFLQNTELGWIVSGPINNHNSNMRSDRYIQCNLTHSLDSVDSLLRQFWELEELPKLCDARTDEERACEDHFVKTTTRDGSGRFSVCMPLKESPVVLGESFTQAERRFLALEKRLQRDPSFKRLYSDFIHEYVSLGHMTRVSSYGTPHYFMPHHGVFREQSTTTKLRVVYDASAPTTSGKSLNDIQQVGPPLQSDIISILLRFRQYRYTACADVEKMYRQCLIDESQRDLQLIIWRDNPSEPLGIYKLNTVTYGTASAPFLSIRCLKQLAIDCPDPAVKQVINNDFYVDDLITSLDDKDKLLELCENTAKVLQSGCFPLRKWVFNFNNNEPVTPSSDSHELNLIEHNQSKTLGLGWYPDSDNFHFNTQFKGNNSVLTKRVILSHASQIFDPLGFLSPSVIIAKVLLQKLWLLQVGWDDPVPPDVTRAWNQFVAGLSALSIIRIPRHVTNSNSEHRELHIFTDASQTAYGACIYVRTVSKDSTVSVRLLCSKGKVAPLKPVSIPRLELCGALLGARLYDKVHRSLYLQFENVIFWTDSTIVLGWLHMPPNLLKTFVQNRAAEIHELTKELRWRHVSGKENPADLVSRGVGLEELSRSQLWWEGPGFLRELDFSCTEVDSKVQEDLPEVKSSVTHSFASNEVPKLSLFPFSRFSQFNRMRRSTAYVLRFIHNARNKCNRRSGVLTVDELRQSELTLARCSQMESFPNEYKSLLNNGTIKDTHLSKLSLFMDDDKIIRVGGRIQNSDFNFDKRHPILISAKHYFSILLFRFEHLQWLHAAPQALLFNLRETWWPVGGRNLARKVVHDCLICTRLRGRTLKPIMGNLPKERITQTFPFACCGVDYAGPMLILNRKGRGARLIKCYICLFVCFVTRAIHLELVSDLSTDAYLLALKRFISRRGKPYEIFSDNGKNFVGLMNDFSKFLTKCSPEIQEYATDQNIKFSFIPPYAPHFDGLWEAGVKSCKYHLRRVIGNAHLTFEQVYTVLCEVESILNSRPLSPLSTDPNDFTPLSPAHFLIGRPMTAPVCEDFMETPEHRLTRYQRVEQIRQHFWTRWAKEYISELQTRSKWKSNGGSLEKGMLVVVKDDNLPPLKWRLGRIINVVPGKDGIVRVADVQTASGVVRRTFLKICPLVNP